MALNEKKTVSVDTHKKNIPHAHNKKWFLTIGSIVIFILATVSFIFLPAFGSGSAEKNKLPPFGKYNGKPILYEPDTYFTRMIQTYAEQAQNSGQKVDQSTYFQILSAAFNATITYMAFSGEVEASGYILPETLVDRTMIPFFTDPTTGQYSPKLYTQTPAAQKIMLRKQITESLLQQRYYSDLFGESQAYMLDADTVRYGLKQSSLEIPFIEEMASWKRSFEIAAFSTDDFPKDRIAAYGSENSEQFIKYDFSVITLDTLDAAKKLQKQIAGSEVTFADGISQFSNGEYGTPEGKLRDTYRYYLKTVVKNPDNLAVLESLTPGGVSEVIETAAGFSIFKCDWPPVQPDFTVQATLDAVYTYMKTNEAGKIEDHFIAKAKDFSSEAARSGFDAACRVSGIQKITTTPFNLDYNANQLLTPVPDQEFPVLTGAGTNENFLISAFALKQNELSAPLLVGKNVIVFRLASETNTLAEDAGNEILTLYPYYVSQFDSASVQSFFFDSGKLQNDLFSVYLKHFLN